MSELPPAPPALPGTVVDAHTHLDACGAIDPVGVRAALDRAAAVGVSAVVTVADDMAAARWVVQASTWDDRVFAATALHPTRTATMTAADRGWSRWGRPAWTTTGRSVTRRSPLLKCSGRRTAGTSTWPSESASR